MRLIAHRGNFAGQNTERENTVEYLEEALKAGYDVEFDVFMHDGKILLGHDRRVVMGTRHLWADRYGDYVVNEIPNIEWLRDSRKWVHCKDMESFLMLSKYPDIQCFMHDDERYAFVENCDKIWVHSGYVVPNDWEVAEFSCDEPLIDRAIIHESRTNPISSYKPFAVYGYNVQLFKDKQNEPWNITTIILDVDGVMTNGKKTYDSEGNCVSKEFCDKDWTAIKRMQSAGLRVIMASADGWNEKIAIQRKVEFIKTYTVGNYSKYNVVKGRGVDLSKSIYIGDDYYDIELLANCAGSWCPSDAIPEVQDISCIIPAKGGENCVAAFYNEIKHHLRENFPHEK